MTHCSDCNRRLRRKTWRHWASGGIAAVVADWLGHARDCPSYGTAPDVVR